MSRSLENSCFMQYTWKMQEKSAGFGQRNLLPDPFTGGMCHLFFLFALFLSK